MTTAEQIHGWHLSKGWSGIGYHFVIRGDGVVQTGRPIDTIGAHAYNCNTDSIGICVCGNYMTTEPSEISMQALVDTVNYIKGIYGDLQLARHRDVNATSCPGDMFPWEKLQKRLSGAQNPLLDEAKRKGLIANDHDLEEGVKWKDLLQVGLNILKLGGK